jgi:hypothetical protein
LRFGINQAIEAIREHCEPQGPITIEAHFDEFNLDVRISYHGEALEFPDERPSGQEIMETEAGYRRLAGYMLRMNADRIAPRSRTARRCWNSISFIEPGPLRAGRADRGIVRRIGAGRSVPLGDLVDGERCSRQDRVAER